MSDMGKDVVGAVLLSLRRPNIKEAVEGVIAAAEPHLRRKHRQELLDELIAEAVAGMDRNEDVYWNHCHRGYAFMRNVLMQAADKEAE